MGITNPIPTFYFGIISLFLMRVSKVITKSGDEGQTGLGDGRRVSKTHIRIQAIGSIDHLNSLLGWAMVDAGRPVKNDLERVQQDLFNLGGELVMPGKELQLLNAESLQWLEDETKKLNKSLPPLEEFILPGGTELSARIHIVRTACRNTERDIVALVETKEDSDLHKVYLNRLSDYLFVLARKIQMDEGTKETQWDH
jgi:cob(I)alamin adenosyltransferase